MPPGPAEASPASSAALAGNPTGAAAQPRTSVSIARARATAPRMPQPASVIASAAAAARGSAAKSAFLSSTLVFPERTATPRPMSSAPPSLRSANGAPRGQATGSDSVSRAKPVPPMGHSSASRLALPTANSTITPGRRAGLPLASTADSEPEPGSGRSRTMNSSPDSTAAPGAARRSPRAKPPFGAATDSAALQLGSALDTLSR